MSKNPECAPKPAGLLDPPQGPVSEAIEALRSDLLAVYRAVLALEKRVNETAVTTADVRPQLIALKVHTDSFPNAMRELRRSQTAAERAISELAARTRELETRLDRAAAAC